MHDPNRLACGLFQGSASSGAELRTHVVLGCVTGKVRVGVLRRPSSVFFLIDRIVCMYASLL